MKYAIIAILILLALALYRHETTAVRNVVNPAFEFWSEAIEKARSEGMDKTNFLESHAEQGRIEENEPPGAL